MIDARRARGMPRAFSALLVGAIALRFASASDARGATPAHQARLASPAPVIWHAARLGAHTFFGTIVGVHGTQLTLRLRNGRGLLVDAAAAIAHGDYSAPLFVGKIVTVDGDLRGTTFVAAHVFRLPNLSGLPADR